MDSFDDNPIVVENNNDFDSFVYNLGIYNIGGAIELSRVYNFAAQNIITNLSEVLVSPIYYSKLNVSQKLSNVINYGFITIKEGNFTNIDIAGILLSQLH